MHALPGTHSNHLARFACAVLLSTALAHASAAQELQFPRRLQVGLAAPSQPTELTEAQVDDILGATAARLEQAKALVASGDFDDVVEIYRELAAEASDRVVAIDDHRFVSIRTYCHMQLARLPAEALAVYRGRVDATADRLFREGIAARDEALLRRIADEMFCSSWGDDALLALGELALERADYSAARGAWEQISPLVRDPAGRPIWLALDEVDLNAHWPEVERRWSERSKPPDWLAFPDTDLNLADIRARLVLVSIRADELDRAASELDAYRRFHPNATGIFAGQEGQYAHTLQRLLAAARDWHMLPSNADWPTFAGTPTRASAAAPIEPNSTVAWSRSTSLSSIVGDLQRSLSLFPVAIDGVVLYGDATQIRAMESATGKPAITSDGIVFRGDVLGAPGGMQRIAGNDGAAVPTFSMTVADGIAYARVGHVVTSQSQPDRSPSRERLIGLDLRRDGLLTFQIKPDDETWSFDGAPLSDGRRVYVAMRRGDFTPRAYVACFDAATGRRLWRTSIGAANTLSAGGAEEITHNLLTLAGDRIYFNTNLGLVAALDADNGRIAWIYRYERAKNLPPPLASSGPSHFDRRPSPCMVADDTVYVAPSDTPDVLALDAHTGKLLWQSDKLTSTRRLLGVLDGRLIVTGRQFSIVNARSGRSLFTWPDSESSGIRGLGRGVLAGREVFWPTRSEIYVFDAVTGAQTRSPIPLQSIGNSGANLVAAGGYLIAAGPDRLMAYGPRVEQSPLDKSENAEPVAANLTIDN